MGLLDQALVECDKQARNHKRAGFQTLLLLIFVLAGLVAMIYLSNRSPDAPSGYYELYGSELSPTERTMLQQEREKRVAAVAQRRTVTTYVFLALCVIVFGVLMAVYRFHLQEISKAEHLKLGFYRIKIIAEYDSPSFDDDVKQALVANAFTYAKSSFSGIKQGRFDSPLPGHPATDIGTLVINKIFDTFDIKAEPKQK